MHAPQASTTIRAPRAPAPTTTRALYHTVNLQTHRVNAIEQAVPLLRRQRLRVVETHGRHILVVRAAPVCRPVRHRAENGPPTRLVDA